MRNDKILYLRLGFTLNVRIVRRENKYRCASVCESRCLLTRYMLIGHDIVRIVARRYTNVSQTRQLLARVVKFS